MMCPVCLSTLAMIAGGATSTGGLATIALRLRGRGTGLAASARRDVTFSSTSEAATTMSESPENDRNGGQLATMQTPPIVSRDAWETAREQLLVKEKAMTRARDALAAERRRMPWMAVEKAYEFEGARAWSAVTVPLADAQDA